MSRYVNIYLQDKKTKELKQIYNLSASMGLGACLWDECAYRESLDEETKPTLLTDDTIQRILDDNKEDLRSYRERCKQEDEIVKKEVGALTKALSETIPKMLDTPNDIACVVNEFQQQIGDLYRQSEPDSEYEQDLLDVIDKMEFIQSLVTKDYGSDFDSIWIECC